MLSIISITVGHLAATGPGGGYNPLCELGDVNSFVLISSYFMVGGTFKAVRFVRLTIETIFYCFAITLTFKLAGATTLGLADLAKSLWPFGPHAYGYWFINKFLALVLLQPFLSRVALALTRRQYLYLIALLLLINSELVVGFPFSSIYNNGWSLAWFITLFFIGGYIRLHVVPTGWRLWAALWLLALAVEYAATRYCDGRLFHNAYNNLVWLARSLCLFMLIRSLHIPASNAVGRVVAFLSPNVLAVYLIHNQLLMRTWLVDVGSPLTANPSVGLHLLNWCLYGLAVVLACTLIDKARLYLFGITGLSDVIARLSIRIDQKLQSLIPPTQKQ